jgi:pimeloyl-ACP methyl ester carboxylesterase
MLTMRQHIVQCSNPAGLHRMAYTEWGEPRNPKVLICVHGLTRCGRDFDFLAQALAEEYRVVCPDVVGRGLSDWLANKALYGVPQYVADMVTLIARLDVEQVHWVGTSMGGLIGMALAAQANTPITKLVLNDVGPVVTNASLVRIDKYFGTEPRFDTIEQAEQYVRFVSATFGRFSDAQWRHLTEHVVRTDADGKVVFRYDPGIAEPARAILQQSQGKDIEMWPLYDAIRCPTLVLRGASSDLLLPETLAQMAQRGPRARTAEIPEAGHAPMLMEEGQIAVVRDYLFA